MTIDREELAAIKARHLRNVPWRNSGTPSAIAFGQIHDDRATLIDALEAAQEWRPIESAPKTPNDSTIAVELLGWCPDETSPIGGDRRTIWWEPRLRGGCWYSDRDMVEQPTNWLPLPAPPKVAP